MPLPLPLPLLAPSFSCGQSLAKWSSPQLWHCTGAIFPISVGPIEADNLERKDTSHADGIHQDDGCSMEDGSVRLRLGGPLCSESLWATPWENTPGVTPQINGCAGAEVTRPTFPGQDFRSSNLRLTTQGVRPYTRPILAGSLLWETQSLECYPTTRDSQLTS